MTTIDHTRAEFLTWLLDNFGRVPENAEIIYRRITEGIPDVEAVLRWDTLVEFYRGDLNSAGLMMQAAIAVQHKKMEIVLPAQAYVDQIEYENTHPAHDPETHQEYASTSNRLWEALVKARHDQ